MSERPPEPLLVVVAADPWRATALVVDCPVHGRHVFPPDSTDVHAFAAQHAFCTPPPPRPAHRPKSRRTA